MDYYIDLNNGLSGADGKTPERARSTYEDLEIRPGDRILFKRGTFVRRSLKTVSGAEGQPVVYGAYGEGPKPVFCGSVDLSCSEDWEKAGENLWKCLKKVPTEAANFIFDNGKSCGALRWSLEELSLQGDWFDNRLGSMYDNCTGYCEFHPDCFPGEQELYLCSEKNPGEYYQHIECAVFGEGRLAACECNMIFEDLCFQNCGVHGICGAGSGITVKNCDFLFIGGAVIIKEEKIRFGNAIEFWEVCENCVVENCHFHNIYDSGITHQGKRNQNIPRNNRFDHNFFSCCGMAAYECRDFLPVNTSFCHNTCMNAGMGFSLLGETLPRNSQIYPLPMGHHVFLWRIHKPTPEGGLVMKYNQFLNAPIGAAIFSMAPIEVTAQMEVDENSYFTENPELCNYLHGCFFETFEDYQKATGLDRKGVGRPLQQKETTQTCRGRS